MYTITMADMKQIYYRGLFWDFRYDPMMGIYTAVNKDSGFIASGVALEGEKLILWYKKEAAFYLPATLHRLAKQHNLKYNKVSVRVATRRWGSCSSTGNISLNSKLILAPEWVSNAVSLHELVHTVHHNHGKLFWQMLYSICPEWDKAAQWLKENYYKIQTVWGK